jgi:glucose-6-phosphate dehydrogenase assembly protein OpcA
VADLSNRQVGAETETYRADVSAVDAAAIEKELAHVWRAAAEASKEGEGHGAVTRSCRWNLVIETEAPEQSSEAQQLIGEISLALPSRAIVLCLEEPASADRHIDAAIATTCFLAGQGKQVCTEQVLISARGSGVADVPAVVLALLVTDLPAGLFWNGALGPLVDLVSHARGLVRNVDRLVIDSGDAPGVSQLLRLEGQLHAERGGLSFTDLSWQRLSPWRSLVAHAFDGAMLGLLGQLGEVRITYASPGGRGDTAPPPQPLLCVGWLMSRLGWRPLRAEAQGGSEWAWTLARPDGGQVAVSVGQRRRDRREVAPGGIIEIELGSEKAGGGRVQLLRTGSGQAVTVMRSLGTLLSAPHVAQLPSEKQAALLVRALTAPGSARDDAQMRSALANAARLGGV